MTNKSDPIKAATALPYPLPVADDWQGVEGETVSILLRRHNLTAGEAGRMLKMKDGKKVREWISGVTPVPYPHWYCLIDKLNRSAPTTQGSNNE